MELNEYQKQQIAELSGLPGFVLLLEQFREVEAGALVDLCGAADAASLSGAARFYRLVRRVRETLETAPAEIRDTLDREKVEQDAIVDPWFATHGGQ